MSASIELKVTGYKQGEIVGAVTAALQEHFEEKIREIAAERIEAMVEEVGKDLTRAAVAKEVERALAEGWTRTNEYGEARGPKVTLKDRISEILSDRDRYSSNRTWLEGIVKDAVEKALSNEFKADLATAKERFRKMLDESVMASWLKVVKDSLGVRS